MTPSEEELLLLSTAEQLFPINRSLTGAGNLRTLKILREIVPELKIKSFSTGQKVNDWVVPDVWECRSGYLKSPLGDIICDFESDNLSLVGYSSPFIGEVDLEDLQQHLHSLPDRPHATPYVTSYYEKNWGFCLPQVARDELPPGKYEVFIDSKFSQGEMVYGEVLIPGRREAEVFFPPIFVTRRWQIMKYLVLQSNHI